MLGDASGDALLDSEFADEYQTWLIGHPAESRAHWCDFPARKLAHPNPLSVSPSSTVHDLVQRMLAHGTGVALVRHANELVGVFSERDLLQRVVAAGKDPRDTRVADVMTPKPEVLPESASIAQALRQLGRARYRHIPIVDTYGAPVGLLAAEDLLRFVGETFPKEVLNAPPVGSREIRRSEGA
jgi:CBS domain-containing protein